VKVVYVAGPYRGKDSWIIESNVRRAETLALEVWKLGAAAICPHANTRFFQGAAADDVWLKGDIEILSRCDAVLTTPDWKLSEGAVEEVGFARSNDIPVFKDIASLKSWLKGK
jgi:hypothetical protein